MRIHLCVLTGLLLCLSSLPAGAVVYQWSTSVDEVVSKESNGHPRAFLWIPEQCQRVRAIVIAPQNMQEEQLFNNASFRRTLAELSFAIVWITPPMGSNDFRFDQGDDKLLERMLGSLADESGYSELRTAPLVPLGHSATASWCWQVAAWKPERTLAVVSLSGQWPYFSSDYWGDRSVDGVPGLTTKGEYEIGGSLEQGWYAGLKKDYFTKHPNAAFSHVVEPGDGHFAASAEKMELINLFLRKAAQHRLPAEATGDGPVALKPIDASKMGWRYEMWRLDKSPESPAAPVGQYKGKLDRSYWAFDEEMARAIEAFQSSQRNKQHVLIGYRQKEGLTAPRPDHLMIHLKFEPMEDGLTFKLGGGFFDTVPAATTKDGKPVGWQRILGRYVKDVEQGAPIPHPTGQDDRLSIEIICGPVAQLARDTFSIRFNRTGTVNAKRCSGACFIMTYPGDDTYKRMVQQAEIRFPLANKVGAPQTIEFAAPANVTVAGGLKPIQLSAKSSANAKVYYYVREGPAEIDDNGVLTFTPIPPRAKLPLKVTVVAWQWGRSIEPKLQSAVPVERTFLITESK